MSLIILMCRKSAYLGLAISAGVLPIVRFPCEKQHLLQMIIHTCVSYL